MPQATFRPIDDSHDALEFEFFSPEEDQLYSKALPDEIPEGHVLVIRRGKSKQGRPTRTIGLAKVGEPLTLPSDETGQPKSKPAAAPVTLDVSEAVHKASDADLEVMAARHGVAVTDAWKRRNRALREADVARAMKK